MKILQLVKSHKIATLVVASCLIGGTGVGAAIHTNSINNSDNHVSQGVAVKEVESVSTDVDTAEITAEVPTEAPTSTSDTGSTADDPSDTSTPTVSSSEPVVTPAQPEEAVEPTNPYQDGTNEHYLYNKRKSLGKTVGDWGPTQSWVVTAKSSGVPTSYDPSIGSTAVMPSGIAYHVDDITGPDATVSAYIDGGMRVMKWPIESLRRSSTQFIH